jgi:hypothetical protein
MYSTSRSFAAMRQKFSELLGKGDKDRPITDQLVAFGLGLVIRNPPPRN